MSQRPKLFYGWWIVVASAIGLFWSVRLLVYSFTVFLKPLMQDFHVGRAAISLNFTLKLIAEALTAPLVGWLIGRYGARMVILASTAMFGAVLPVEHCCRGRPANP